MRKQVDMGEDKVKGVESHKTMLVLSQNHGWPEGQLSLIVSKGPSRK